MDNDEILRRHTAYFLVAGDELKSKNEQVTCNHATNKQSSEE